MGVINLASWPKEEGVAEHAVFYFQMWAIVTLFGQPADHLLDNGKKTKRYFNRTHNQNWKFKVPQ